MPEREYMPVVEVHSGAGGTEADRWVADLSRFIVQYAQHKGWMVRERERVAAPAGGAHRVVLEIQGANAYRRLRSVQGTHRVQREAAGPPRRVRTSTATVTVIAIDAGEERQRQEHGDPIERSEKIRTYNYVQDRVTDHRIDLTLYGLDHLVEAHLDHLADVLDARGEEY